MVIQIGDVIQIKNQENGFLSFFKVVTIESEAQYKDAYCKILDIKDAAKEKTIEGF